MKILVLGSEGFIGSHCIEYFLSKGHTVTGADLFEQPSRPYRYYKVSRLSPALDELFDGNVFDAVVNAAGSGNVPYSMSHPILDFEANSLDTIRVLDCIRTRQPSCRYLYLSSAAVYGNPSRLPVLEEDKAHPLSPYGWHKLIAENVCMEYSTVFGLSTAIVRPFSVYGPGLRKQMFWDIYQKFKQVNGEAELLGTGNESRDYVYISDLIAGLDCVLQNGKMNGESYNLASGAETKIKDAVSLFVSSLGANFRYRFNGVVRAGDPLNWNADISKIRKIGFEPSTSFSEGMKELADWIVKT